MNRRIAFIIVGVFSAAFATACGSGREVEVSGEISAPSSLQVAGPLRVELYDVIEDGETRELELVHSTTLDALGAFSEKADFEGERIVVRAIDDQNEDEACSSGEAWGEAEVAIDTDDKAAAVAITLAAAACPATGD